MLAQNIKTNIKKIILNWFCLALPLLLENKIIQSLLSAFPFGFYAELSHNFFLEFNWM